MRKLSLAITLAMLATDASASTINRTTKVCPVTESPSQYCVTVKRNTVVIPVEMDSRYMVFSLQPNGGIYIIDRDFVND